MVLSKAVLLLESIRSRILALFIFFNLKPNHLTLMGGIICIFAGVAAGLGYYIISGIVFLFGSVLDAFDGELARRTDRETKFGAFLDSLTDRFGEGSLLLGILYYESLNGEKVTAFIVAIALFSSLLVSYVRARGESLDLSASGGIAPRQVRVPLMIIPLFFPIILQIVMITLALISFVTVVQRSFSAFRD